MSRANVEKSAGRQTRVERMMAIIAAVAVIGGLLFMLAPESLWHDSMLIPASERRPAPQISLPDLDGRVWNITDHRGKVVLVNYWATWCPPCRAETPSLVNTASELGPRGLEVVGISLDETKDVILPFVAAYKVSYPILFAQGGLSPGLQVHSIPTTLLIDKQGHVAASREGAIRESALKKDIEQLLAE